MIRSTTTATVGELRKLIEGLADDVPVAVINLNDELAGGNCQDLTFEVIEMAFTNHNDDSEDADEQTAELWIMVDLPGNAP